MSIFDTLESQVRSYCRGWPATFDRAAGSWMYDEDGKPYLDFFAGAGALNYGHNHPDLKQALIDYIQHDGVTHGLDMATAAKREFLKCFERVVLEPRGLDYKVQFPGPTGTNSVEAALKLARKVTGRESIINFTNAFHGMTLGALSVTGSSMKRSGAGIPLVHATPMPYDNYLDGQMPDFLWLGRLLQDPGSGLNEPAAVIVETTQGEGGLNVARYEWLQALEQLCRRHGMLLIVDDVQMGCGRTGPFFSFEPAGITPDIITLSKSISGYGLPMALTLLRPDLDVWAPGEHNGTFRGNNLAFVTATRTLEIFWTHDTLQRTILDKGDRINQALNGIATERDGVTVRGRGMAKGLAFEQAEQAAKVCTAAFDRGLLMETAGPRDEVAKLMPALTISYDELNEGLGILTEAVAQVHD